MSIWFHMLPKPSLRFVPLDRHQLAEVQELLDANLRLMHSAHSCDAQAGWKLLECCGRPVNAPQMLVEPVSNSGCTWAKFGDPTYRHVVASKEESSVAAFFLYIVSANAPVHLVEEEAHGVVAAADAFAEGDVAGLGGWWLPPGRDLELANIQYFAFRLKRSDLPAWFCQDHEGKQVPSLQSCICALEALAPRLSAGEVKASLGRICVRQQCDNLGVVCSTSKGLSMRRPLSFVLQASAVLCMRERVNLRVSHIAGVRNVWADALSRGQQFAPEIWSQLCASDQCHRDWRLLLGRFGLADRIKVLSGHSRFGLESGLGSCGIGVRVAAALLWAEIYLTGAEAGACGPLPHQWKILQPKVSTHATWFQVCTTGTVRVGKSAVG